MTVPQPEWSGEERRGIPIHVINYMREAMTEHVENVKRVFSDHTKEEMDRYSDILAKIKEHGDASQDRHKVLVDQLATIIARQELMENSFPRDANGNPDYQGHLHGHTVMIKRADDEQEVFAYVKQKMTEEKSSIEDRRFIKRSVIAVIVGVILMWAGKELIIATHGVAHQPQTQGTSK